jgi:diguanylate cyclase (GGDEF)-like protein/PAS domain S-box-containing protein
MNKKLFQTISLKTSILLPLVIVLVVLIAGFTYAHIHQNKMAIQKHVGDQFLFAKNFFDSAVHIEREKLSATLASMTANSELKQAMIIGDRNALMKQSSAIFQTLRKKYHITHFYFHRPDRVNFLRVHQPNRYGDMINRFSALQAERTGKPSSALEIGPLGLFTLRVVFPWYEDKKLIGYIELGEEIEHIYRHTQKVLDIDLYVLINKKILSKSDWERGMKMLKRQADWKLMPNSVVAFSTIPHSKNSLVKHFLKNNNLEHIMVEIEKNERIFKTYSLPLRQAGPDIEEIGRMIFLHDITDIKEESIQEILRTIWFGSGVSVMLLLLFYLTTRRIEENLQSSQKELLQSENRFRMLVENSTDLIWEVNSDACYVYVSPQVKELLGYEVSEMIGQTAFEFLTEEDASSLAKTFLKLKKSKQSFSNLVNTNRHKDGHVVIMESSGVPIINESGKLLGYRGINRDITKRIENEKKIEFMAYYDSLTGLPNRTLFKDRLEQESLYADREKGIVGVLFMGIDHFKVVNDTKGHMIGDRLLQEVAHRLRDNFRASDTVSRFSGDTFAIIIPYLSDIQDIYPVLESVLRKFETPFKILEFEFFVTFSSGISFYPLDDTGCDALLRNADTAMYYAKSSGRNKYMLYNSDMTEEVNNHLSLKNDLKYAINNEEMILYYQPQIDLQSNSINGFEALVRWHHPVKGLISPADFIPIAEKTGLIIPLGEWVLRTACKQIIIWQKQGYSNITMAVNLSSRQFKEEGFVQNVIDIKNEYGLEPNQLELELTESILMDNDSSMMKALQAFKDEGILLAIDDFGTGYSSLSYLNLFPFDKLKIDRAFTKNVTKDLKVANLVNAIISMAKALGLKTLTEGVETQEELDFIVKEGCHEVQGYFTGRPMDSEQVQELLNNKQ